MTGRQFPATPGQTVGPFFGYALPYPGGEDLVPRAHPQAVRLHGTVFDGAGAPVTDALIEIWQSDPDGRIVQHPGSLARDGYTFTGWGRSATDATGHYTFTTLEPGRAETGGAPFIAMTIFARGLMNRLFTRVYLPDDAGPDTGSPTDTFLRSVAAARRPTLIARRERDGALGFDIHLQGDQETVILTFDVDEFDET